MKRQYKNESCMIEEVDDGDDMQAVKYDRE